MVMKTVPHRPPKHWFADLKAEATRLVGEKDLG